MNKIKRFFVNLWSFLRKFPVFMTLAITIPVLGFVFRYMTLGVDIYQNYYYGGEKMPGQADEFELTSIKALHTTMDVTSTHNYQGGACFENYYALAANNFEAILIYDTNTNKVEHAIPTDQYNTDYHCNTMFFGSEFFISTDKFPLLYISMENINATIAFRIYQTSGIYHIQEVSRIYLNFTDKEDIIYFPNSYYDYDAQCLYYSGYTQNTYVESEENKLKYYKFHLPDYRFAEVELHPEDAIDTFELPSLTATQGGFVSSGHLYQTFSFNSATDPKHAPKMRVLDLNNHKVVKQYDDLGATFGTYDEFEHIALARNGKLYGHGQKTFKIYEFEYKYVTKE